MKEWFYVKNDLKVREDIKEIIMRPIWSCFGLRKPKVEIDEATEECRRAFGIVCSFIGTRDLVQEHVAYGIWPLILNWEMPKETISNPNEGGLVRLKYTFRFGDQFIEPDDDWLKCIEATSDELLGPYSKVEDNALSVAFGSRKKKRLNRVFDAIGFMYADYRYPPRGQKRKSATSGKDAASAAPSEPAPKRKKVKVLTQRPRYIEPTVVPEFGGETSSATEPKEPTPTQKIEEPTAMPKKSSAKLAEPKADNIGVGGTKISEITSPSAEVTVPKAQKGLTATPKRKNGQRTRCAGDNKDKLYSKKNCWSSKDAVWDKSNRSRSCKKPGQDRSWAFRARQGEILENQRKRNEKEASEQILPEKTATPTPKASSEVLDYFVRHASGKMLSEEEKREAQYYARKQKYPKGALIFNGSGEEDFLYCLPDSKEISVCREMSRSFGFPTLEDGLSVLSKD
jgi:hypothetical protein